MSLVVRPATADDRDEVDRVSSAAFAEEGPTILRLLRALEDTGAVRSSLVAEQDGRVVGHVQLSRCWVDARERLVEVLVLSPLSVDPDHQGRGVGTALLEAAVRAADDLGAPAVVLEGDWGYYGARGFRSATSLGFTRPSPRIPEPAFQVRTLTAYDDRVRGPLVYCEAFWATDTVGLRDPFLSEVEERARTHPSSR